MHFCLTGQYTPKALNSIMENPKTNRYEAAKKLIEAAGGKLISMYSTAADGPGVLVIFDVPDPIAAPAISGTVVASGAIYNAKLSRLWTQDEITQVRQKASRLRGAYTPPWRLNSIGGGDNAATNLMPPLSCLDLKIGLRRDMVWRATSI
jgi:uncharacterized protein with GYD domain